MNFFLEQIVSRANHKHCIFVLTFICIIPMLFLEFFTYLSTFLAFYEWYSTWGLHNFLGEKNLFPRFKHDLLLLQKIQSNTKLVSIRLGALSSLILTILDLGLPHAAPMQGESLGTNQADIMAWPASPTMWKGLNTDADCLYLSWHDRPRNPVLTMSYSWSIIEGS